MPTQRDYRLTCRETAQRLGVHENTVRNWQNRGLLHAVRLAGSGYRRYSEREVEELAAAEFAPAIAGTVELAGEFEPMEITGGASAVSSASGNEL
jgi:excisionase family DNA binding protein